jgi:type 1 fimbria pilin
MKAYLNNKTLLALGVAALLPAGSSLAATASGGTVNFSGSVVTSACAISANSANIDVDLGEVRTATLAAAGSEASTAKAFTITLEDCEIADTSAGTEEDPIPATTVAVTFTGTPGWHRCRWPGRRLKRQQRLGAKRRHSPV